jgi:hypothetical protein
LIKIGAVVDVERGLIQVRHGPRANVEVLPLTLQRMNLDTLMRNVVVTLMNTHLSGDPDMTFKNPSLYDPIMPKQVDAPKSNSNTDTNNNEHCDEGPQLAKLNGDEYEFGNIELEDLVMSEGPHQILQLIL